SAASVVSFGSGVCCASGVSAGSGVASGVSVGSTRAPDASSLDTEECSPADRLTSSAVWAEAPIPATNSAPPTAPTISTAGLFMALETLDPGQVGSLQRTVPTRRPTAADLPTSGEVKLRTVPTQGP